MFSQLGHVQVQGTVDYGRWRVRYMVANQPYELCEAVGSEPTKTDLVPAYVRLLHDNEAEVRIPAAGKVTKFSRILDPELAIQHIAPFVKELSSDSSQHVMSALAFVIMGMAPVIMDMAPVLGKDLISIFGFALVLVASPGTFNLVGTIVYEIDQVPYQNTFYNGTIEVTEAGGLVSVETVFLVSLGLASLVLFCLWVRTKVQVVLSKMTVTWTSGYNIDEATPIIEWGRNGQNKKLSPAGALTFTRSSMCGHLHELLDGVILVFPTPVSNGIVA